MSRREELPGVLALEALGDHAYAASHPENDPEGRGVVFSGQLLAQMIMAADLEVEHALDPGLEQEPTEPGDQSADASSRCRFDRCAGLA